MVKYFDHTTMRWLLLLTVALLLNACSDTDALGEDPEENRIEVELMPYVPSFLEVAPIKTRAYEPNFPTSYGYKTYSQVTQPFEPQEPLIDAKVHMLYTKGDGTYEEGNFYKTGDTWHSLVKMEQNQFYLYGYIPEDAASLVTNITPATGGYQNGITFKMNNLSSVSPADICVTVAAGRGYQPSDDTALYDDDDDTSTTPTPEKDFGIGKFGFKAKAEKKNYVFMLFNHIYASISFGFKVNADYTLLRTIKLKRLRLLNEDLYKHYNATVTLKANVLDPLTSVVFEANGSDKLKGKDENDGLLFWTVESTDPTKRIDPIPLDAINVSEFRGCFVPGLADRSLFSLESTYDVYDTKGNLIRKDCVATNSINVTGLLPRGTTWERGVMLKLTLIVNPTYLYMLSDPDLDNPTVTLVPPTGSGS